MLPKYISHSIDIVKNYSSQLAISGLLAVVMAACNGTATPTPQPSNVTDFVNRIESKYGINVTLGIGTVYYDPAFGEELSGISSRLPLSPLTDGEISTLEEAIESLPFCLNSVNNFSILRNPFNFLLNPDAYFQGRSSPRFDDGSVALTIAIMDNVDLDSKTQLYNKVGINTLADYLKFAYYHECGHTITYDILRAAFPEEYAEITNTDNENWHFLEEKKNPIYISFAKLEGWQSVESELIKENPTDFIYIKDLNDSRMVFDVTNSSIGQYFAELFGLFMMDSPVLTLAERSFFGKIKEGFETNPEEFAKKVAQDPMLLLKD